MQKLRDGIAKYGTVLGLVVLAGSVFLAFAAKSHDLQTMATSQNVAIAGLALVIAGRR